MNSVIIPDFQEPLLRFFNKLIELAGFKFTISVNQLNSLTLIDKISPNEVLTINEQRGLLGFKPETDEEKLTGSEVIRNLSPLLANNILGLLTEEQRNKLLLDMGLIEADTSNTETTEEDGN